MGGSQRHNSQYTSHSYFSCDCAVVFVMSPSLSSCSPEILKSSILLFMSLLFFFFFLKVFNLLTSSVSVTINGRVSRYHPGQSYMVPCGKNMTLLHLFRQSEYAQLYFIKLLLLLKGVGTFKNTHSQMMTDL